MGYLNLNLEIKIAKPLIYTWRVEVKFSHFIFKFYHGLMDGAI
jgi:hypothetical protein